MDISVVIPAYNEDESLPELSAWIDRVMKKHSFSYEMIFIDDGSKDDTWKVIQKLGKEYASVKGIKFRRNYGKSAALQKGFEQVEGDVIITMDADLQDSPEEIPELYRMISEDKFDIVSGWKKNRHDPLSKTIPTKLYNAATRLLSGIRLNDMNCGLKAYRNEVVKSIEVYGEMHRYIPVIAKAEGFDKIGEKVVQHQARKYGVTKFGLERFIFGFLDLLSITFVSKFGKRPMHLFGTLGTIMFALGVMILMYLSISKLFWDESGIATRPLFFFGIVTLIVGSQLFLTGFTAELLARNNWDRNKYQISDTVGDME